MKRIMEYLSRPISGYEGERWKSILLAAGLVLFLLSFIQSLNPGSVYVYEGYIIPTYVAISGYALVTAISMAIVLYGPPVICSKWFEQWTIGKNIVYTTWIFLFISVSNILYDLCLFSKGRELPDDIGFLYLLSGYLHIAVTMGVISMVVILIYQKNRYLTENLQQVQQLNESLINRTQRMEENYTSSPVLLSGNTKDSIELYPEELLFVEAEGNYVKIHYLNKGSVKQKLLRATIRQIEDTLHPVSSIVRCHRAFIVNTEHIKSIKGNSQGYRLVLSNMQEEIPVSRAYTKILKEKLELLS